MEFFTRRGKDLGPGDVLVLVENHFVRVLIELDRVLNELEATGGANALEVARAASDMRKATQTLFDERSRLEQSRKKTSSATLGTELDLEQARSEIGRRLACLRDGNGA